MRQGVCIAFDGIAGTGYIFILPPYVSDRWLGSAIVCKDRSASTMPEILAQAERWVLIRHQQKGIGINPQPPAENTHNKVEDRLWILAAA